MSALRTGSPTNDVRWISMKKTWTAEQFDSDVVDALYEPQSSRCDWVEVEVNKKIAFNFNVLTIWKEKIIFIAQQQMEDK